MRRFLGSCVVAGSIGTVCAGFAPSTARLCSAHTYGRIGEKLEDLAGRGWVWQYAKTTRQDSFVSLPVYSSMYSASFCWASCFGIDAGPSLFSFFARTRRPLASVVQRWKNPTQTFPSRRRSILLIQPSGASARGTWRPRRRTSKSTGRPSGVESLPGSRPESKATTELSAMAAVYVRSMH